MAAINFPTSPQPDQIFNAPNGQTYQFDAVDSKWVIQGATIVSQDLNDLSDVIITNPVSGEVLKYNGSSWVDAGLVAAEIANTPAGSITSGDVQAALNELDTDIQAIVPGSTTLAGLTDTTITAPVINHYLRHNGTAWINQAIPASQVTNSPAGTISATTVQAAIDELDGDIGALTAADITIVSVGNVAATDVQAAIEELEVEKVGSYATQGGTGAEADVNNIVSITQAAYDALGAPDANTLYLIDG